MSEHAEQPAPSAWVARFAPMMAKDMPVLDLACGSGRHVALLLSLGYRVTALDRDLSRLGALAADPDVETIEADLEDGGPFPLAGRRFAGIVVTNYLHRPLFPALAEALDGGGLLIYETFAEGNERFGKPSNPEFLLRHGELLEVARRERLRVLAYEDMDVTEPKPACVQRIAALKPEG